MGRPVHEPSIIYAIRNKMNGKVYIGRSQNLSRRIRQHWQDKRRIARMSEREGFLGKLNQFEQDFKNMGQSAFEVYIIEENVPPEKCSEREAYWIEEYNSTDPRYGYNLHPEKAKPQTDYICGLPPNLSKKKNPPPGGNRMRERTEAIRYSTT